MNKREFDYIERFGELFSARGILLGSFLGIISASDGGTQRYCLARHGAPSNGENTASA